MDQSDHSLQDVVYNLNNPYPRPKNQQSLCDFIQECADYIASRWDGKLVTMNKTLILQNRRNELDDLNQYLSKLDLPVKFTLSVASGRMYLNYQILREIPIIQWMTPWFDPF